MTFIIRKFCDIFLYLKIIRYNVEVWKTLNLQISFSHFKVILSQFLPFDYFPKFPYTYHMSRHIAILALLQNCTW
jgi:hypothetical protein